MRCRSFVFYAEFLRRRSIFAAISEGQSEVFRKFRQQEGEKLWDFVFSSNWWLFETLILINSCDASDGSMNRRRGNNRTRQREIVREDG